MADGRTLLGRIRRPGPLVALSIAYLALVSGIMIWRGISVDPDYLLLVMVPLALLTGRFFAFLRDWVPFIALFLGYEALAGVAPKLGIPPHVYGMVRIERDLFFGRSPNQVLQSHLGDLRWLAIACTIVYFCHFLYPLLVGLVLWLVNRQSFLRYVVALLGMSFAAFVVFLLFPTGTLPSRRCGSRPSSCGRSLMPSSAATASRPGRGHRSDSSPSGHRRPAALRRGA